MRIVCISDTHGYHRRADVTAGDILVHAGDLTAHGTLEDVEFFNSWLGTLPHPYNCVDSFAGQGYTRPRPTRTEDAIMPAKPETVAYSYLRFSSAEQARGDSIRRQIELRDGWLTRSGARLDTSVSLRDDGKSAFTGEHRRNPDRHALAAFLRLVEKGRVPKGSYLIVENLDRLSREHIQPALILFLNLLQAGVRVVQLLPVEQVFDAESESMAIMMAIMELSRGNSESRMKSERIGRAWSEKKRKAARDGTPVTAVVPAWLKVTGEKIVTQPARAAVVKRIFRLVTAGHGLVKIANTLTTEKVPTFGRSSAWNPSSVYKIVHSRAAVGEYQPRRKKGREADGEPVAGYFPAVVTDAEWWAATAALKSRHEGGRRSVRHFNPFAGLLTDARDGGKLYVTGPSKRSNTTLVNYGATRGKPGAVYVSFPLTPFVESVLTNLREVSVADVLGIEGDDGGAAAVTELEGRVAELESRTAALQVELESGDGEVRAAVEALRRLEARREPLVALLAAARAKSATPLAAAVGDCRGVIDLFRKNDDDDTRARLKAALRRVVSHVVCLFVARGRARVAAVQVWFKDTGRRRDFLIVYTQGRGNAQVRTPASWSVVSSVWPAEAGELDLRNPDHAARLGADLLRQLGREVGWQGVEKRVVSFGMNLLRRIF